MLRHCIFEYMVGTTIPVTPLVKHIVCKEEGSELELSRKNIYSAYLVQALKRKYNVKIDLHPEKYCEDLRVLIGDKYFKENGFAFEEQVIIDFNNYVTRIFYKEFFRSIDFVMYTDPTAQFLNSYTHFIELFNIDPDIFNYERAKKSYYRHRERQSTDNQTQKMFHQTVPRKTA